LLFQGVYVDEGASLQNCIFDKNVRVPAMTHIGVDAEADRQRFTISDNGIVVVLEGYVFD
jgi:glucose-1-phosphate adenylyltransferase